MGEIIKTVNNGPEIVSTSYWHTEAALRGYVYLSINAGCFRLLVPDAFVAVNSWIKEAIIGADCVIITRGPWREMGKSDGIEILFEDHSDEPYALHIVPEQVELMPAASDRDRPGQNPKWTMLVYTENGEYPVKMPVRFRVAKEIPWLKPWSD